jgi:hypothetical protein
MKLSFTFVFTFEVFKFMVEYWKIENVRLNDGSGILRCENIASWKGFFFCFFLPILWGKWTGDHPQDDLAKFGYRS